MLRSNKKHGHHQYDTLISNRTDFKGDLHFSGGVHIDGHVKGAVIAKDNADAVVRISDHGVVEGEVRAPHIIINGTVIGDVYSSVHLELAANAVVTGTVHYNLIEMVMGARVNGNLLHHESGDDIKQSGCSSETIESGQLP